VALPRDGYSVAAAATAAATASVVSAACPTGTCSVANGTLCLPTPFPGCGTGINYNSATPVMKAPNLIPIFYGTWTAAQKTIINNFLYGIGEYWTGSVARMHAPQSHHLNATTGHHSAQWRLHPSLTAYLCSPYVASGHVILSSIAPNSIVSNARHHIGSNICHARCQELLRPKPPDRWCWRCTCQALMLPCSLH
jgi:hypothetical protein